MQTNNAGIHWVSHLFCREGLDKHRRFEFLYICLVLIFVGFLVQNAEESQTCICRIGLVKPRSVLSLLYSLLICLLTFRLGVGTIRNLSNRHVEIAIWTASLQTVPLL
jgi:hypothetical protein